MRWRRLPACRAETSLGARHRPSVDAAANISGAHSRCTLLVVTRIALILAAAAAALAGEWKAGVARVNITPKEPIWLAGYAARTKPSEGVLQDLWLKALALEDGSGAVSVLVTSDLLGFTRQMSEPVGERVQKKYGVARARLILNASHTHSGPVTGQMLRPAYGLDEAQAAVINRYTAWLLDQVVDVIGQAVVDLKPATLDFEQGFAGFAVNRRRVGNRQYPGPVDHDVPVLAVRDGAGKLRAAVVGYACHATVLADQLMNGDWPGFMQEAVEKTHPGTIALFVAGCGADANPLPRRSVDLARKYGEILAEAARQVMAQKMAPVGGPIKAVFDTVDLPFATPPSRQEFEAKLNQSDPMHRRHARLMLDLLDRDGKLADRYPYPVQVWRFGPGLKLIVLGGEVVVDYALRFKAQYGWNDTWVAGYSNDVFAYIPSLRVLREGGYEGASAMIGYGQPAPFRPAVEEIVAEKVDELMRQAAR